MRRNALARLEREEIEAVDINVGALEERVEVRRRHPVGEELELDLRVDVARHLGQHVHFRAAQRRHRRAGLAIEIGDVEGVEIGEMGLADAEACQRQQMDSTDAAESGDRDALAAQALLLEGVTQPRLRENAWS